MPISSIVKTPINYLTKKTAPIFNWVAERPSIKKKLEESISDPGRFAGKMVLLSIVSKDLVNCGLYTYQSWNNEKIPEDKRKFVALVDLMNGIVMVGGQLLAGIGVDRKLIPWVKSKFTGTDKDIKNNDINIEKNATNKIFHNDNIKSMVHDAIDQNKMKNVSEDVVEKVIKNVTKKMKEPFVSGLGIVITTIATTAIVKRMLAPLISTPAAGYINDKVFNAKGDTTKDNRMTYEWIALATDTSKYNHPEEKRAFNKVSVSE